MKRKLMVRVGPTVDNLQIVNPNDEQNPPYFETPNFKGFVLMRIKDFHGIVPDGCTLIKSNPYFDGKKHMYSLHIQGTFSRTMDANELVIATEWEKPIKVPSFCIKFWHMVAPHSMSDLSCDRPYIQSFAITASSIIQTWSDKVSSFVSHIQEDISSSLPPNLQIKRHRSFFSSEESTMVACRRKLFSIEENRKSLCITPDMTMAFETFNNFLDPNNFWIRIPGMHIDLLHVLDDQPLRFNLRTKDGKTVFIVVELSILMEPDHVTT